MKKQKLLITFSLLLACICAECVHAQQQNLACLGLKNPTNFVLTGGTASSSWTGYTGSKNNQASTCTSLGVSCNTTVTAANLESQSSGSSCTSSNSVDIHGNSDVQRRFVIKGSGTDPLTSNHLSYLPPDPSFTSSIRLGNNCGGTHEAEQLVYQFTVNNDNKLVTIWYALSLQNGQHGNSDNPEFVIRVLKQNAGGNWVPAAGDTLCYVRPTPAGSSSNVAPFYVGSTGTQTGATYACNIYLPWNKVLLNLENYYTQTIRIEISAGDCAYSAHYACCYIAGDCQGMVLNANGCAAGTTSAVATIAAPKGANNYAWYRSKTGVLSGAARATDANYQLITGANDSVLEVSVNDFINVNTGDTNTQNTFMCKMTTYMNESMPIVSNIYTEVGNMKPRMKVDSTLNCDAGITLYNKSFTPFDGNNDSNKVDTNLTVWKVYSSTTPTEQTLMQTYENTASINHTFPAAGTYCVTMRTMAVDTSCWNEKSFNVRVVKTPRVSYMLERDSLCANDTITMRDATSGATWHKWVIHYPEGDTTIVSSIQAIRMPFASTTDFDLYSHTNTRYMQDTNNDGIVDPVHCIGSTTGRVQVQGYPVLSVHGDTIVCTGDQSDVWVESDIEGCQFDWYSVLHGTTPVVENNSHLITTISEDRTFYVKVTSPFGCESWDSVNLYLVKPSLNTTTDKICTGDEVTLWAGKAATYTWTSSPADPGLVGQETGDSIHVSPTETTTYTVVGHGSNGCSATALSQKITVYPYPIMGVQLTPDYIDSENPSVQFTDVSENATSSLWDFGGGHTSTTRSVVFTFTDLSQDSLLISLTSYNQLGCSNDTSFYLPVGIFAVWFPNAFTPKLETNKTFHLYTANELTDFELYVYDRYGSLVWQTNDPADEWDGTYNGHDCKSGTYVYICRYRRAGVERMMSQKGTVTLIN